MVNSARDRLSKIYIILEELVHASLHYGEGDGWKTLDVNTTAGMSSSKSKTWNMTALPLMIATWSDIRTDLL